MRKVHKEFWAQAPMLAIAIDDYPGRVDWSSAFAQPKFDGYRCLARRGPDGKVGLWSSEGRPITTMGHVAGDLDLVLPAGRPATLDGELYAHGMPFERISSAVCRVGSDPGHREAVKFHAYDVVADLPYADRLVVLEGLLGPAAYSLEHVSLAETVVVRNRDEVDVCQRHFVEAGFEGAMLRHGRTPYEPGKRSAGLLEVKTFDDAEFEVVDVVEGWGKSVGMVVFICVTPQGHCFRVTAPDMHEDTEAHLAASARRVGQMLTVKFQKYTTTGNPVPRFPVAKGFRDEE